MWRVLMLLACLVLLSRVAGAHAATIGEDEWIRPPDSPYLAGTPAEKLAAEVMMYGRQPQATEKHHARYVGEDRYYSLVEVVEFGHGAGEAYLVELFRMLGTRVVASHAEYRQDIEQMPPERQQYAYDIALQFHQGKLDPRPIIYEGKYLYRPKWSDKCEIIVEELNLNRELLHTFSVDVCR